MKTALISLAVVALALPSLALENPLSGQAPAKPISGSTPAPVIPEVIRQGGDTIAEAFPVTIPLVDMVGTTTGYNNDYEYDCPYVGSAPDVVYSFVPDASMGINIDMLGSAYDTKIWVYDVDLNVIASNDDYYPDYTSRIENMLVTAGEQYYLIVDGYGEDHGEYLLNMDIHCEIDFPAGALLEGEPPLAIDYVDTYNGGCGNGGTGGWQYWDSPALHGITGFYTLDGANFRDTDWFEVPIGPEGILVIEADAQLPSFLFELGPQDCEDVAVLQDVLVGPCDPGSLTITGDPGSVVWIWFAPYAFGSPNEFVVYEYEYYLINHSFVVRVEEHSFSGVKALFR